MNDLITVVVPVYNVEKYLDRCVSSIVNQTYKNLEIILVDDGSSDNCPQMCDEWGKKDARIKVIHKPNGGLSDARNAGITAARGEYISFVDSDDYLTVDSVEYLHTLLQKHDTKLSIARIWHTEKDNENHREELIIEEKMNAFQAIKEMLYSKKFGCSACAKLYERALFEDVFYPVGKVYEDLATTYRVIQKAGSVVWGSQICYYCYANPYSITRTWFSANFMDALDALNQIEYAFFEEHNIDNAIASQRVECICSALLRKGAVQGIKKLGLWHYAKENRLKVLLDSEATKRVKYYSICSFFGMRLMKVVLVLYSWVKRKRYEILSRFLTEIIIKGTLLFPILTLFQGIESFDAINRIWIMIVCSFLAVKFLLSKHTVREFFVAVLTVCLHLLAFVFTKEKLYHVNVVFYLLIWVFLYLLYVKEKERIVAILRNSKVFLHAVIWLWTCLIGVAAIFPSSYADGYFMPFGLSGFRSVPTALVITALIAVCANCTQKRSVYFFLAGPIYIAFMNNSRTYFGVFLLFLIMILRLETKSIASFWLWLVPVFAAGIVLLIVGGVFHKFEIVQQKALLSDDMWSALTSGRTEFWRWDIEAFFELPFWQQFVGNGYNFVYNVNDEWAAAIWAHNDVINIAMNFGYLGIFVYCWVFFKMLGTFWQEKNRVPVLAKSLFLGAVFLNSMMNMSYTYLCAVIAYPLFLCVIDLKSQNAKTVG